jgi:hypothetical protein
MPREPIRNKHGKIIGYYDRPMNQAEMEATGNLINGILENPGTFLGVFLLIGFGMLLILGLISTDFSFSDWSLVVLSFSLSYLLFSKKPLPYNWIGIIFAIGATELINHFASHWLQILETEANVTVILLLEPIITGVIFCLFVQRPIRAPAFLIYVLAGFINGLSFLALINIFGSGIYLVYGEFIFVYGFIKGLVFGFANKYCNP